MTMQFVRAKKRQKLVRRFNLTLLSRHDLEKWNSVSESFDFVFKDFRKLQIIKKARYQLPRDFLIEYDRYKRLSRLETVVTISMLLFAAFGYYFCK